MKVMLLKYRRKISERFQTLFWSVTNTKDESLHPDEKEYGRIVGDEMRRRGLHGHITLEAKLTPRKKFGYKKLIVVSLLLLLIFLAILLLPTFFAPILPAYATGITLVQGNARGTSTSATLKVTLTSTPTSGNVLVLTFGCYVILSTLVRISSISQTGVTWAKVINKTDSSGWGDDEIWFGVISSGASKNITLTLSGSPSMGAVADACEYSGVATSSYTDENATNTGNSAAADTGTTGTTSQASELWIGSTTASGGRTQSTPTNNFTLLDGANFNGGVTEAYLEKIVSAKGTADSGTTISGSGYWVGCIATFKATPTGYPLNLRVQDWLQDDNIQGAYVYEDTSVKTSDANGWANWTGLSGTVQIKVKYYGFWVNGTFSVSMTSSQTINVRCKLYDVTVKTVTNVTSTHQALLDGTNVTCFNATSGGTQIATGTTGTGGTYQFLSLPNNTLTFICRGGSSWSKILLNTTLNVNTVGSQGSQTIVCTQNYLSTSSTDIIVAVVKSH